jgi:EAL and modified HD-GYP domain-containing signal transduction protein
LLIGKDSLEEQKAWSFLKFGPWTADNLGGIDRMAKYSEPVVTVKPTPEECAGEVRYVARQPILDAHGRVHGYELLFRDGPEGIPQADGDLATRTILDDTVLFGLERYTNGLPGFVHCSAETLTEHLVQVLPPSMTVLVIPARAEPTPRLVEACLELKACGFRLALDDIAWHAQLQPVTERADYIAADFSVLDSAERANARQQLSRIAIAKIAKKVETLDDYQQATAAGFTLFQGGYFCQPVLVKNQKAPANRFFHFELLRHLNRETMDLKKVSELVERDASLTYRLLRFVNSPICAIRQEVRSIESALLIVGEAAFRRIANLAIISELSAAQTPEILQMALLRARFCGLAADLCAMDPEEQHLLGLLSLLPAMLGLPMEALTPSLPLRAPIREALEGTPNPERSLLTWLEFHEQGNWAACDSIVAANGPKLRRLIRCYSDAVDWARTTLGAAA